MSALDRVVEMFPNRFGDIDLDPYRSDDYRPRVKNAREYSEAFGERIRSPGVWGDKTGFMCDDHFRFRPSEMTIWTGYKGHGKSAVLSQVMLNLMLQGKKVFVCSPEFHPVELLYRFLVQYTASDNPNEDEGMVMLEWFEKCLWMYDVQSSLKKNDVPAICRWVCENIKPEHIIIDSLMKCGIAPDDYAGQKTIVDQLQSVAHQNPIHMHLVAHARKGDSDDKPPRLHDIKGASEIGDLVENVVCVWRNKPKEKGSPKITADDPDAMFVVEAQRNCGGWIGNVPLWYERKSMLYYEIGRHPESYVSMKRPEMTI
jgi:twinkle protein